MKYALRKWKNRAGHDRQKEQCEQRKRRQEGIHLRNGTRLILTGVGASWENNGEKKKGGGEGKEPGFGRNGMTAKRACIR